MSQGLDPSLDFQDDGGTPEWRRRHMPRPPLIVMRPTGLRRVRAWYRRTSPAMIYVTLVGGFLLITGGIALALAVLFVAWCLLTF